MPRTVSASAIENVCTGPRVSKHHFIHERASTSISDRRQLSLRDPYRPKSPTHETSVESGIPSPPPSGSDDSDTSQPAWRSTGRKVLRNFRSQRLSSVTNRLPSPPNSDSDDWHRFKKNDENAVGQIILRRRRRPLQLALPDGPADETYTSVGTADPAVDNKKQIDSLPFPLEPLPIIIAAHFPASDGETGKKFKRRCASAGSPHREYPTTPDRFIAKRSSSQDATENFRINKHINKLSNSEKLLRHHSASPDPFESPTSARVARRHISGNQARSVSQTSSPNVSGTNLFNSAGTTASAQARHVSTGAVWNVGGSSASTPSGPVTSISDGRGGFVGSGTNAPMYTSRFFENDSPELDRGRLERRLAAALDIDQVSRVLNHSQSPERYSSRVSNAIGSTSRSPNLQPRTTWENGQWVRPVSSSLLDAPGLRDDYYCSVLAYSETSRTLAVGLSNKVYLWSEGAGVQYPALREVDRRNTYVTSLSFSSEAGGHSILATGRNDGHLSLWSLHEQGVKFQVQQTSAIACIAFKPVSTRRSSVRFGAVTDTEELLVGDEFGTVYYYSIEWMTEHQSAIHGWNGSMTLIAKVSVHSQQICGLAWSSDGEHFATGANDNACCLFNVRDILGDTKPANDSLPGSPKQLRAIMTDFGLPSAQPSSASPGRLNHGSRRFHHSTGSYHSSHTGMQSALMLNQSPYLEIAEGRQRHKWMHSAAIKAIAFCPWQRGLLATGGGSNDRAIHFYHTFSGACIATIDVQAQVTSLIWSTSRREIAATFGYAQPEHPYRIAVFSWPECRQVVAIPWANEMRALLAIAFPGGPNETSRQAGEGETWWSRTAEEGCIVVASSDESVKFHEVWTGSTKSTGGTMGLLGGSDILEGLEGIDKEGAEVIR